MQKEKGEREIEDDSKKEREGQENKKERKREGGCQEELEEEETLFWRHWRKSVFMSETDTLS